MGAWRKRPELAVRRRTAFAGENILTNLLNVVAKTGIDFPVVQAARACGFLDVASTRPRRLGRDGQ